jgi:hypothetical protein
VSSALTPAEQRRHLAVRLLLGAAAIVAAFFFFERERPFTEVWKPLLTFAALAVPAFFILDKVRRRTAR